MISVIIPVYNSEKYINECINSVLSQKGVEYEVVVVDDGSIDDSLKILEVYKNDGKIKLAAKENGGANSARIEALRMREGDELFFLDADDYILPNTLSAMSETKKKHGADIVTCAMEKVFPNGKKSAIPMIPEGYYDGRDIACNVLSLDEFYKCQIPIGLCGHLINRNLIEGYLYSLDRNIFFSEDRIIWMAFFKAKKMYLMRDAFYQYRMNSDSVSHSHSKSIFNNEVMLTEYLKKELEKENAPAIMKKELAQFVIRDFLIAGYEEAFGWLDELYPFEGVKKGERVIVYGAGAFGQELVKHILKSNKYELIAWVDSQYGYTKKVNNEEMKVQAPLVISDEDNTLILVAVTLYRARMEIETSLAARGIDKNRIKNIAVNKLNLKYINPQFKRILEDL